MAQKNTLPVAVGLDIGSANVRCVVGLQEADSPAPSIIGVGVAPTTGVRRGNITDIEETVSAITAAVDEAERVAGINVARASVGINGSHILSVGSHGIVAVGTTSREITSDDVARAQEAATVMQLPPNREIVQASARKYIIDGQEDIKDPVGMNGLRLEVDSCLITAATPFIKNISRGVNQAGLGIDNYVINPLAASTTLVSKRDRELGCVLVDIGAGTTGMAVFEEEQLMHVAVIPIGSGHITNDLAIGLRTDVETAEKVKLEHVDASPSTKHSRKEPEVKVKDLGGENIEVSRRDIADIAQARLDEIFDQVDKELKKIKRDGMLPGGVILCGGGSKLAGIEQYVKHALRLPARVEKPDGFSGIVDKINDPAFGVAIGLMLDNLTPVHQGGSSAVSGLLSGAGDLVKSVIRRIRKQ